MTSKTCSRRQFQILFLYLSNLLRLAISCESSASRRFTWNSKPYFPGKSITVSQNLSSAATVTHDTLSNNDFQKLSLSDSQQEFSQFTRIMIASLQNPSLPFLHFISTQFSQNIWTRHNYLLYGKYYKISNAFLFLFTKNTGYQGWNSQNACQKSKQGRPWSDCFLGSSLIWVCPVCLDSWQAITVQNFRTFTLLILKLEHINFTFRWGIKMWSWTCKQSDLYTVCQNI